MHRATAFDPPIAQYEILSGNPQHKRLSLVAVLLLVLMEAPVMLRQIRNSGCFISSEKLKLFNFSKQSNKPASVESWEATNRHFSTTLYLVFVLDCTAQFIYVVPSFCLIRNL